MNENPASVFFGHANGFPAPVYRLFREAVGSGAWSEIERLGHSRHGVGRNWMGIVQEVEEYVKTLPAPRIGIGHSLGAFAIYLAEAKNPGLFNAMVLMEPPMLRPSLRTKIALIRAVGLLDRFPPVSLAKRRRRIWPDRLTARAYFNERILFADFDSISLDDYLHLGLEDAKHGVTLRFSAETEHEIFRNGPPPVLQIRPPANAWFLYGEKTRVLSSADFLYIKKQLPGFLFVSCQGGHLFPVEKPAETGNLVRIFLENEGYRI